MSLNVKSRSAESECVSVFVNMCECVCDCVGGGTELSSELLLVGAETDTQAQTIMPLSPPRP